MKKTEEKEEEELICPLKNETIIVHHVARESALVHNPKHINYGGMAEGAARWLTVPRLRSGQYADVLTKNEKAYLEDAMGLEYNALSVHKVKNNFWSNFFVKLQKQDNYFNLGIPEDYIKYKVLLANTDIVAPSFDELQSRPKATYEFVILHQKEEEQELRKKTNYNIEAYKEFGKIEDNRDKLRVILETATGKPITSNITSDALSNGIDKLIQSDAKMFLKIAKDPLLDTKVILRNGVEAGSVILKNGLFYTVDGKPLCDKGDATMSVAAGYLSKPKNQQLRLTIEAKNKSYLEEK